MPRIRFSRRFFSLIPVLVLAALLPAIASAGGSSASHRWPDHRLQLGVLSPPGEAAAEHARAPFGLRYAYLSGGVNTGDDWRSWANGNGDYVSEYISESESQRMIPVFSFYEIRQSLPGAHVSNEATADLGNLNNRGTMRSYYKDLIAFFHEAASATGPVVLQIEPDLWGYIEQRSSDAAKVPAAVSSTGLKVLRGLHNNASGFAQAILKLRADYAPRVLVGYHDSIWGTYFAIQSSHPTTAFVKIMAKDSVGFYKSLRARFNVIFAETSDRDAAYAEYVNGLGTSEWWKSVDYEHLGEYLGLVHHALKLPIVIWQIPVGNTIMRVMNNTPYHYQDNKVQTLLAGDRGSENLLRSYVRDGVVGLLFGSGQSTDTCACDNDHNDIHRQPAPINGNKRHSYSDADDGGYLMHQAAAYYRQGAFKLR